MSSYMLIPYCIRLLSDILPSCRPHVLLALDPPPGCRNLIIRTDGGRASLLLSVSQASRPNDWLDSTYTAGVVETAAQAAATIALVLRVASSYNLLAQSSWNTSLRDPYFLKEDRRRSPIGLGHHPEGLGLEQVQRGRQVRRTRQSR